MFVLVAFLSWRDLTLFHAQAMVPFLFCFFSGLRNNALKHRKRDILNKGAAKLYFLIGLRLLASYISINFNI